MMLEKPFNHTYLAVKCRLHCSKQELKRELMSSEAAKERVIGTIQILISYVFPFS